jgi:hexosaminidase
MSVFRRIIQFSIYITIVLLITACFKQYKTATIPSIIPIPNEQLITKGVFELSSDTKLTYDESLKSVALFFKSYIEYSFRFQYNS